MLMITYLTTLLLILAAGICNGAADSLQFHFAKSFARKWKADYWNPDKSWRRKYEKGDPAQGPAFFGSTTFLVFLTDAWHLAKFLQMACFRLSIVFLLQLQWYWAVAAYLALWSTQVIGFHLLYTLASKNKLTVAAADDYHTKYKGHWL